MVEMDHLRMFWESGGVGPAISKVFLPDAEEKKLSDCQKSNSSKDVDYYLVYNGEQRTISRFINSLFESPLDKKGKGTPTRSLGLVVEPPQLIGGPLTTCQIVPTELGLSTKE